MNFVFNIITYLFFILLFLKVVIHVHLDNVHGYRIVVSPVSTWQYLLPYDKDVLNEYKKKKVVCNKLQKLSIGFLVLVILCLVVKAILK